jgi:hypothetical protein
VFQHTVNSICSNAFFVVTPIRVFTARYVLNLQIYFRLILGFKALKETRPRHFYVTVDYIWCVAETACKLGTITISALVLRHENQADGEPKSLAHTKPRNSANRLIQWHTVPTSQQTHCGCITVINRRLNSCVLDHTSPPGVTNPQHEVTLCPIACPQTPRSPPSRHKQHNTENCFCAVRRQTEDTVAAEEIT